MNRDELRSLRNDSISRVARAVEEDLAATDSNVRDAAVKLAVYAGTRGLPRWIPECRRFYGVPFPNGDTLQSAVDGRKPEWKMIRLLLLRATHDPKRRVRKRALIAAARLFFDDSGVQTCLREVVLDAGEARYVRGAVMTCFYFHTVLPHEAVRTLTMLMGFQALRPPVLQATIDKQLTPEVTQLLMEFVNTGSRDEAVAATRVLTGRPIRHLGAIRKSRRGKGQNSDDLNGAFVVLENCTARLWVPRLDQSQASEPPVEFTIGNWRVDPSRNVLSRGRLQESIQPRTMAVLQQLAKAPGTVVSKEELLANVWRDRVVGNDAVHRRISDLRRIFGDKRNDPKVIETVTTLGYRLIAPVRN